MRKPLPPISREALDLTDRLFEQAAALIEARRLKDALPILEKMLVYDPCNFDIIALIGTLYSEM